MCCLFVGNLAELMYNTFRRYQSPQISVTGCYAKGTLNITSQYNKHTPQRSAQVEGQGLGPQTMFAFLPA